MVDSEKGSGLGLASAGAFAILKDEVAMSGDRHKQIESSYPVLVTVTLQGVAVSILRWK